MMSYLSADDSNLQTSIDMYSTMRFATNAAADSVGDANNQSTTTPTVPQRQQSVSSFT